MAALKVRCLTWNISAGVLGGGPGSLLEPAAAADYIAHCIAGLQPDAVALQEVPFFEPESEFIEGVARKAGFEHKEYFPVSPSHLHENARMGIAVLSRFPLVSARRVDLPNPNLIIELPDGQAQKTHDKAMLVTRIKHPDGEFYFICAHLPPFAEFNRRPGEPMFRGLRTVMRDAIRPLVDAPVLFSGDINSESMKQLVPELLEQDGFRELIHRPTKSGRDICDQIACSRHWTDGSALVLPSKSDHSICVGDLLLGEEKAAAPARRRSTTILHLSDLHLGPGAQEDVDWKQYIEEAERDTRAARLERRLRLLPAVPDYVVLSGDFTIGGRPEGFKQCREILLRLIDEEILPPADHILVVPGNHDVTRKVGGRFAEREERWEAFRSDLGDRFVRPWLTGDPPAEKVRQQFQQELKAESPVWGGVRVAPNERTKELTFTRFPVLFDRAKGVLFYLFNSASVSGARIRIDEKAADVIKALQAIRPHDADALNTLVAEIDRLREVDAARINPNELDLFVDIMSAIRKAAPAELDRAKKIAVLHHHIAPIYPEEVKQFELLLNAGQFKKSIAAEGFRLVLHGHKHWPEIFTDTALGGGKGARLSVISGGTIGGWSTQAPGFHWIEAQEDGESYAAFLPLDDKAANATFDTAPRSKVEMTIEAGAAAPPASALHADLRTLYDACERSMIDLIRRQTVRVGAAVHENVGWNNFLGAPTVTPFGTAYGLQVMKFLNADSSEYRKLRHLICDSLSRMRRKNLGWSASSLGEPGQPVETAIVLNAMSRLASEDELQKGVDRLVAQMSESTCSPFLDSTTGVSIVAQSLAELAPQSPALQRLVDVLLHGGRTDQQGRYLCWDDRTYAMPDRPAPREPGGPSVPHTAHVMITLRRVHRQTGGRLGLPADQLRAAAQWVLAAEWQNTAEAVEECDGKRLPISHYTSPTAVLALLLCDYPTSTPRIVSAVEELWRSHENGLWAYEQVRWPVWATLCCLETLTEFAFRSDPVRRWRC